jgi:8-oxo-dGTP pyrophosphatase MutT (NUDIX family)
MRIIVVNDQDEIIGYKERSDLNRNDITRVAGLDIFNSKGEDPGKWGPAAAGTLEEGETYLSNIVKEAEEELGIILREDQLAVGNHEFRDTSHKYFRQLYSAKLDLPIEAFKIQKEEVEGIRWIAMSELSGWLKERPQDFIALFHGYDY